MAKQQPAAARRVYADTRLGQLHLSVWPGPADSALAPVVCLHPVPYSGRYFDSFAAELSKLTSVVAPDLPGYGNSDPLPEPVPLEAHALAVADALQDRGIGRCVPLGFHTGAAVAGELAIQRPRKVPKLVFVTYPFIEEEERIKQLQGLGRGFMNTEELDCLRRRWRFTVHNRAAGVPLATAFNNFVDELRAGECAWFGFDSMFRYRPEDRLGRIRQPVLVINVNSSLQKATQHAAELLPDAHYVAFMEMNKGVFHLQTVKLAAAVARFLQTDTASTPPSP